MASTPRAAPSGFRGLRIAIGVIDIVLAVVVLALPGLALLTLSALLALVLFITGIEMLVSGINGRTWLGNVVKAVTDEVKNMTS